MTKTQITGISFGIVTIATVLIGIALFDVQPVEGNQFAVLENYFTGVNNAPKGPRTYFIMPHERMYVYDVSQQVYVMNDRPMAQEGAHTQGRELDSYKVQSSEGQTLTISLNVQYHLEPAKIVEIHKRVRNQVEDKVLRPVLMRVVKDEATRLKAIDAYSGEGLVKLQSSIQSKLTDKDGELADFGVRVDNFVIEHIELDLEYITEIRQKQVAQQRELRNVQEERAAQAEALKAKAMARADYEKAVVEAERDKQVKVLGAEANNEQEILKAEAEKRKVVLAAEAEKESGELKAQAILAIGRAQAESEKLKFSAFSADGADLFVKMQVAESMSRGIQNVRGYLPEGMSIFSIGSDFNDAVNKILNKDVKKPE
jgi:regulator of protease activity HflC (stomatin/prohibitin superfamily)